MRPPLSDILPTTIVELYAKASDVDAPWSMRWRAMYTTPEHLLRVATLPLLAYRLTLPCRLSEDLPRLIVAFSAPTFSSWKRLSDELVNPTHDDFNWGPLTDYRSQLRNALKAIRSPLETRVPPDYSLRGTQYGQSTIGLFMAMRNFAAHSTSVPESTCQRDVSEFLGHLEAALDHFRFFDDYRFIANRTSLHGPIPPTEILASEAGVEIHTPNNDRIALSPFAVASGIPLRLEVFDGYQFSLRAGTGTDHVYYQTQAGRRPFAERAVHPLRAVLETNGLMPLPGLTYLTLDSFAQLARKVTEDNLTEMNAKYDRELYIERCVLSDALRSFATAPLPSQAPDKNALLLTGGPGSGKSALLAGLARDLLRHEHIGVLFIRGHKFAVDKDSVDVLYPTFLDLIGAQPGERDRVRHFHTFLDKLDHGAVTSNFRLIILLDAINEVPERPEAAYLEFLKFVTIASHYTWVRLIGTVRRDFLDRLRSDIEGANPDPLQDVCHLLFSPPPDTPASYRVNSQPLWVVPPTNTDERKAIYERFRERKLTDNTVPACATPWDELDGNVRDNILDRPLLIRLWMNAYDGRPGGNSHQASDVYIAYLDSLAQWNPALTQDVLPRLIDHMLRAGRFTIDKQDDDQQLSQDLAAAFKAGLFELHASIDGPAVYRVFHDRLAEALAARRLWQRLTHSATTSSPPRIAPQRLAAWNDYPRRSDSQLLFGGLELLIRRLIDNQDWGNVAVVLEHVDFQMPPQSSWLFHAGRQRLSIELRETLHPHLRDTGQRQMNLYQIALAYTRQCDYPKAAEHYDAARGLGGSQQMIAAIAMYTALNLMELARQESCKYSTPQGSRLGKAEQQLRIAETLAKNTTLEGNVYGHRAGLRRCQLEAAGCSPDRFPSSEKKEILGLYRKAITLNQRPELNDDRSTVYWLTQLGRAQFDFRKPAEAAVTLKKAQALCEKQGLDAKCKLDLHLRSGDIYSFQCLHEMAKDEFRQGLKLAMEIGDGVMEEMLEQRLRDMSPADF
jgi:hypothetical protein